MLLYQPKCTCLIVILVFLQLLQLDYQPHPIIVIVLIVQTFHNFRDTKTNIITRLIHNSNACFIQIYFLIFSSQATSKFISLERLVILNHFLIKYNHQFKTVSYRKVSCSFDCTIISSFRLS